MRFVLVLCVFSAAGTGAACSRGDGRTQSAPLTDSLLSIAREWSDDAEDDAWSRAELDRIAAEVRRVVEQNPGVSTSSALNETLFGTLGFVREVDDTSLRFVLLPSVLESRRGSCVGLGSLYLALGERLGWKIGGVMVPGHFFVRIHERGASHNLELLRRGETMPDEWYRRRFPIAGGTAAEYARILTSSEVLGVVEYDVGNQRRRQGRLVEARRAYDRARRHFPDFAEAHASVGAIAHLLGALEEARAGYEAARQANPHLLGIEQNIELLESERKHGPIL
jgi:regulator of sirC expression with transglutaminase-like and TPR domain